MKGGIYSIELVAKRFILFPLHTCFSDGNLQPWVEGRATKQVDHSRSSIEVAETHLDVLFVQLGVNNFLRGMFDPGMFGEQPRQVFNTQEAQTDLYSPTNQKRRSRATFAECRHLLLECSLYKTLAREDTQVTSPSNVLSSSTLSLQRSTEREWDFNHSYLLM